MKKIYLLLLTTSFYVASFAQAAEDTTDGRFHDDLLNHLAGNWNITSTAHGSSFTGVIEASWKLNHQFFHLHSKSNEVIPWWKVPMEYEVFIGYNHRTRRYVVHGVSIEGDADLSEGFGYGYRDGNEFKTVSRVGGDSIVTQRFIWQPSSGTWNIRSNLETGGKIGDTFLEMWLVPVKSS
ncbi:MAG TPA: hypothetical protein VL727_20690 [Puia sp.]|jgi:hypothetical protein|nr:hypothetical protein [Puia sp.]